MACSTSYSHYRETLEKFLQADYRFVGISDYFDNKCEDRCVLLRHDIDKSPEKALDLARIENDLGIRATYFVRIHSNYYNPCGYEAYDNLQQIVKLRHHLSLHSEAFDFGRIFGLNPVIVFKKEVEIVRSLFGLDCNCYAPHRTHNSSNFEEREDFHKELSRLGYRSIYEIVADPKWKYLSDSSGIWIEGCFCEHLGKWEKLLLLIHPVWWYRRHIELEGSVV